MKKNRYECIRCGYKTEQKNSMKDHLFNRKKICGTILNNIELTEEIKNHIINFRVYHIPHKEPNIIQNIQYNNTMNNYINNMDSLQKLGKYMDYKQLETISLEDDIERKFARRIDNLKGDKFKFGYDLGNNRLFDIIEDISKIRSFKNLNIIYDEKLKELNLFKNGTWENYLVDRGMHELVDTFKDYFLDYYEKYLLRKIHITEKNERQKQAYKEHLLEYYKFIGCFEIRPYVEGKDDCDLLGEDDGDFGVYRIEEYWMPKYKNTVDNMKRYEINRIKKQVDSILRNNSIKNLKNLNKEIIDLVTNDEEFKATLEL